MYLIFPSLKNQRRLAQTKVHFYFLSKETAHKPSKVATAKKLLSSVYVTGKTSSDKCFLMYVITERHLFRL